MGEDQGQERTQLADDQDKSAAELQAEIEDVREDLGDTAAALASKTDVKTRARAKADELKRSAKAKTDNLLSGGGNVTSDEGSGAPAAVGSGLDRLRTIAKQNPVPTVALGAVVGGFLLGRLTRRQP